MLLHKIQVYNLPVQTSLFNVVLSLFSRRSINKKYKLCVYFFKGEWQQGLEFYEKNKEKCVLDSISYTIVADTALNNNVRMVYKIFDEAKSKGLADSHLYGIKLRALFFEGRWKEMAECFEEVKKKRGKIRVIA